MKKKIFLILITMIPVLCLAQDKKTQFFISGYDVRLRETPGVSGKVVGLMEIGTPVKLLEVSTSKEKVGADTDYWYHVELSEMIQFWQDTTLKRVEGWVFGKFIGHTENYYYRDLPHLDSLPLGNVALPKSFSLLSEYTWHSHQPDENIVCTTDNLWVYDDHIVFAYYETQVIYRLKSVKESSPGVFTIEAGVIFDNVANENYEKPYFFPAKSRTFILTTRDNLGSITLTPRHGQPQEYPSDIYYNSAGRGFMVVNSDNAEWTYIGNSNGQHDHASQMKKGKLLIVDYVSPFSDTINGEAALWFTVHEPGKDSVFETFGKYLSTPTQEEVLSKLPELNFHSFDPQLYKGKHWEMKTDEGIQKLYAHRNYIEIVLENGDKKYLYYDSRFSMGGTMAFPSRVWFYWDKNRNNRLTATQIDWVFGFEHETKQFYLVSGDGYTEGSMTWELVEK